MAENARFVALIRDLAAAKDATPAQVALAWVLAQGQNVIPIPGTKHVRYLEQNVGAMNLTLSDADLKQLNDIFPAGAAEGLRYPEQMMGVIVD